MNKNIFHLILFIMCTSIVCSGCSMSKELQGYLLGNSTPTLFGLSIIIQVVIATVMLVRAVRNRDKTSNRTPPHWSWSFFWKDTFWKLLMTFIFILAVTRIMFYFKIDPGLSIVISIFLGLLADRWGNLFAKAQTVSESLVSDRIDQVADQLKHTATSVNDAATELKDIKKDVATLQQDTPTDQPKPES